MIKQNILEKSKELFLQHGVKTVGMDDIANALHISKKTIYQHFASKNELVKLTLDYLYDLIYGKIRENSGQCETPIHEHFEIIQSVDNIIGKEIKKSTFMFQVKKYYPEYAIGFRKKNYFDYRSVIYKNLEKGIEQGFYRKELDKEFIATQMLVGCKAFEIDAEYQENYLDHFSQSNFDQNFLDYSIRGIVTPKGLEILEKLLQNEYKN